VSVAKTPARINRGLGRMGTEYVHSLDDKLHVFATAFWRKS
jgi:hypothetical protein